MGSGYAMSDPRKAGYAIKPLSRPAGFAGCGESGEPHRFEGWARLMRFISFTASYVLSAAYRILTPTVLLFFRRYLLASFSVQEESLTLRTCFLHGKLQESVGVWRGILSQKGIR